MTVGQFICNRFSSLCHWMDLLTRLLSLLSNIWSHVSYAWMMWAEWHDYLGRPNLFNTVPPLPSLTRYKTKRKQIQQHEAAVLNATKRIPVQVLVRDDGSVWPAAGGHLNHFSGIDPALLSIYRNQVSFGCLWVSSELNIIFFFLLIIHSSKWPMAWTFLRYLFRTSTRPIKCSVVNNRHIRNISNCHGTKTWTTTAAMSSPWPWAVHKRSSSIHGRRGWADPLRRTWKWIRD